MALDTHGGRMRTEMIPNTTVLRVHHRHREQAINDAADVTPCRARNQLDQVRRRWVPCPVHPRSPATAPCVFFRRKEGNSTM